MVGVTIGIQLLRSVDPVQWRPTAILMMLIHALNVQENGQPHRKEATISSSAESVCSKHFVLQNMFGIIPKILLVVSADQSIFVIRRGDEKDHNFR